jgi:hypothetical protein
VASFCEHGDGSLGSEKMHTISWPSVLLASSEGLPHVVSSLLIVNI